MFVAFAEEKSLIIIFKEICWTTFYVQRSLKSMKLDWPQNLWPTSK
jgi:hypothetical protein